ncbi:hypothetical protein CAI21_03410 [Alkalilimnicola ehrlichii]|uniref:MrpA C-terminal/MbhD domain-containing protein n=1 Tax=Alkalilimnicola ehrlichii TaxID=351052 RepID=A0A3E0X3F4_9GAMM|nr:hydrogenase subunit MbhD domain-containing protein [Alkalilimnicola ehrlichii]RFA31033.1 hypothetical protein CAI21_03410 [Alkalilimnicola ehrlichii]RFA38986.1 hypothetical protein CAL65_03560 [Alkalilimnicola ehrlichii]
MAVAFDILLGGLLLMSAWAALAGADLFRNVAFMIVFGVLMALAWLRLQAPDVALAEAAVGAGITGVLLIVALARVRRSLAARVRRPDE